MACESNSAQTKGKNDNFVPAAYKQKMDEIKDYQLVDVRTPGEFAEDRLENAINIDYNSADFTERIEALDKNKPTFIYCLSGGRSGSALKIMLDKGFKEVYNLKGGIMQWKGDNFKVINAVSADSWKGMTKDDYLNLIPDDANIIVDFKAKWCGPCKQLKPILDDISNEFGPKVKVLAIDVDEHKSLADDMRITGIPYLVYYKNGKQVNTLSGLQSKKQIVEAFGIQNK